MIGFIFKTIFWVSVVWMAIGGSSRFSAEQQQGVSSLKQHVMDSAQQAQAVANGVNTLCQLAPEQPQCAQLNALQKQVTGIAVEPSPPIPHGRPRN